MGLNNFSDYGSGSSLESNSPLEVQETWEEFSSRLTAKTRLDKEKSSSFFDLEAKRKFEENMEEFKLNGIDSPYDPEEDNITHNAPFGGLGPPSKYLRQKSWPVPEATPAVALPRVDWPPKLTPEPVINPIGDIHIPEPTYRMLDTGDIITEEQRRVLKSLPNSVVYSLLRQIEQSRGEQVYCNMKRQDQVECRFCKNNGERASFYRSHALRSRGRVSCPVLRAFVCRRCGARGDHAHTLKYCPLATADERKTSIAMMASLRMSSGKRRPNTIDLIDDYVVYDAPLAPLAPREEALAPLDPIWEALERKLML